MRHQSLILVNSVYQLFTAMHIKRTLLAQETVDIILSDLLPAARTLGERLSQTALFNRVIYLNTASLTSRYLTGSLEEIAAGFAKANSLLAFALSAPLDQYDQIFFANPDTASRMLAYTLRQDPAAFIWYEDGFSTYVIDFFKPSRVPANQLAEGRALAEKIQRVLLYEPGLCLRGGSFKNAALPPIDPGDAALLSLYNFVFDYQPPALPETFIFLEQSFRAEQLETNDRELMQLCREHAGRAGFVVKPHPRVSGASAWELGLSRPFPAPAETPWELFLMNGDLDGKVLLTVCSSAALSSRLLFNRPLPTLLLYPLFRGRVLWKEDAVLRRYLRRFMQQYAPPCFYAPQTKFELAHIMRYYGAGSERTFS